MPGRSHAGFRSAGSSSRSRPPTAPWRGRDGRLRDLRRHRYVEELARVPDSVALHVLPVGEVRADGVAVPGAARADERTDGWRTPPPRHTSRAGDPLGLKGISAPPMIVRRLLRGSCGRSSPSSSPWSRCRCWWPARCGRWFPTGAPSCSGRPGSAARRGGSGSRQVLAPAAGRSLGRGPTWREDHEKLLLDDPRHWRCCRLGGSGSASRCGWIQRWTSGTPIDRSCSPATPGPPTRSPSRGCSPEPVGAADRPRRRPSLGSQDRPHPHPARLGLRAVAVRVPATTASPGAPARRLAGAARCILMFPEGENWTPMRRSALIAACANAGTPPGSGRPSGCAMLPPRPRGGRRLTERPDADVAVVAHRAPARSTAPGDLRRDPVRPTVPGAPLVVCRGLPSRDPVAIEAWLDAQWTAIDAWVSATVSPPPPSRRVAGSRVVGGRFRVVEWPVVSRRSWAPQSSVSLGPGGQRKRADRCARCTR